uniref:Uncharacterized protein n=1 Tax=viral metagenome TaxID=1070528 RepID=A0A6C0IHR5_9ZZZZ
MSNPVSEVNNPTPEVNNPTPEVNNPVSEVNNPVSEVNNPVSEVNNNKKKSDDDEEELSPPAKMFIAYIELIYRVLDKIGVSGIDMFGSFLNLNVNGKKITEQEPGELVSGFKSLSEKMADPKVKEALYIAIDRLSPVVKKSAKKFVNLFIEVFKTGLVSSVAVACEIPPLSVMCGMSKSAASFLDLAAKSMGMASSSIDDVKEAKAATNEISNVLSSGPANPENPENPENPGNPAITSPITNQVGGGSYIQIGGKTMKSLSYIQSAGSQIRQRIDDSIKKFNNPLKYYKKTTGKNKNRKTRGTKKNKRGTY